MCAFNAAILLINVGVLLVLVVGVIPRIHRAYRDLIGLRHELDALRDAAARDAAARGRN